MLALHEVLPLVESPDGARLGAVRVLGIHGLLSSRAGAVQMSMQLTSSDIYSIAGRAVYQA